MYFFTSLKPALNYEINDKHMHFGPFLFYSKNVQHYSQDSNDTTTDMIHDRFWLRQEPKVSRYDFSVSPSPFGLDFGTLGLGLDNNINTFEFVLSF